MRISREERRRLRAIVRSTGASRRLRLRARIVLGAAGGQENQQIAAEVGTSPGTVALWRGRFRMLRLAGIERDAPRPGRPPRIPTSTIQLIVRTTEGPAPPDASRWSARRVASALGVSKTTVQRVWKAHHLPSRRAPGPARAGPLPGFGDRVTDFVGLYLNPPERALAFSVDDHPPDSSERDGPGSVPVDRAPRDPSAEFRAFLQKVDRETPPELDVHLLLDSRAGPPPPEVRRWLVRHPRFVLHRVPEAAASPNLIDRLLREFTRKRVRSRTPPSAARLHGAIQRYYAALEGTPGPFVWTASSDEIRASTSRRSNTTGYYWTDNERL